GAAGGRARLGAAGTVLERDAVALAAVGVRTAGAAVIAGLRRSAGIGGHVAEAARPADGVGLAGQARGALTLSRRRAGRLHAPLVERTVGVARAAGQAPGAVVGGALA